MSVTELHIGVLLVHKDRLVQVVRIDKGPKIIVRDLVNNTQNVASPSDLHPRQPPVDTTTQTSAKALDAALDSEMDLAAMRERIVLQILAASGKRDEVVTRVAQQHAVAKRSIYRWIAAYQNAPRTSTLLSHAPGASRGSVRLSGAMETLIQQVIEDLYLVRTHAKPEDIYRECVARSNRARLRPPSRKAVGVRINRLDPAKVAFHQLGAREAKRRFQPVPGSFDANEPLAVVQLDHTLVDAIIVDEQYRQPIGRPWLSVAIDVYTRVILGISLSLEAPSALSVALCLTHACLPKDSWLSALGVETDWPVWGLPRVLHTDNAQEFMGQALRRGCSEFGIDQVFRPPGTPHFGGHIERLIGTLMGRVHLLPGSTNSNVVRRRGTDPEKSAALTLRELLRWISVEICERYHRTIHSGIRTAPLSAWQDALDSKGKAPPIISNPQAFLVHFLPAETRTFQRYGLTLFGIRYWDNILPTLVRAKDKLLLRYDPRNLAKIYVEGANGTYHPVPYADLRRPPISLWEHNFACRVLRQRGITRINEQRLFEAILSQREIVKAAAAKTKHARRSLQRRTEAERTDHSPRIRPGNIDYDAPVEEYPIEIWEPPYGS
jgi:putative transposase